MKAAPRKKQIEDGRTVYVPCDPKEATHIVLWTPGPFKYRQLPIGVNGSPLWSWNQDVDRPTLQPSILTTTITKHKTIRCHCFIEDGKVRFLSDCTHEYAGQTLDLLDIDN